MNYSEQQNSTYGVVGEDGSDQFDARRREFRTLHERGCFVIPNPWDVGSARYLQHPGFTALATTSASFAFLPVNADFASGYGTDPSGVADSVARCVATGVAGLSVEDATGERSAPLYDLFAPGVSEPEEIRALVEAAQPKPLNLLIARDIGLSVGDIAALGVRRISVGPALALAAWPGFMRAAQTLKSDGSFAGLADLAPYSDINNFLATDQRARRGRVR